MTSAGVWGVVGAVVGAAVVGGIAYAASTKTTPPPATTGAVSLIANHTYAMNYAGPITPNGAVHSAARMQTFYDSVFGAGSVKVVLACVTDPTHVTIVFTALKSFSDGGAFAQEAQSGGGTMTLTDITGKPLPSLKACIPGSGGGGPPPPGGQPGAWTKAATINPGDNVRASITSGDLATFMLSFPAGFPPGAPTVGDLNLILSNPLVQSVLMAQGLQVWGPNDSSLPSDWPPDDTGAAAEFHIAFKYGGAAPIPLANLPIPLVVWTMPGVGVGQAPAWKPLAQPWSFVTGQRYRMSLPLPGNVVSNMLTSFAPGGIILYVPNAQGTAYVPPLPIDWPTGGAPTDTKVDFVSAVTGTLPFAVSGTAWVHA